MPPGSPVTPDVVAAASVVVVVVVVVATVVVPVVAPVAETAAPPCCAVSVWAESSVENAAIRTQVILKGFPFVKVQAEAMSRRYDAAATPDLPAAEFRDHGAYGQVVWGVRPMWTVGLRYDTVGGDVGDDPDDPAFRPRERASLQGTWYPTEYSKLRLQYAHDDRDGLADANSVWLQFEFLLGAHAAHKF